MWLLHFLPDSFLLFIVNTILLIGIVSSFLAFVVLNRVLLFFPPLASYHKIFQVVSALLLVLGIYFKGGYSVEMQWRERVAELEAKVAESEAKSQQANKDLSRTIKSKTKIVKEVQVVVKERIVREAAKMDAECKVDASAISIMNDAAKLRKGTVTVGPLEPVQGDKK